MNKLSILRIFVVLIASLSIVPTRAEELYAKLHAEDYTGMKFTVEVYKSSINENKIYLIIYKDATPMNKIYGNGTDLGRGFYYVNTDSQLFDIVFRNGNFRTVQPFKNKLYIYYCDDDFFIAAKDTIDSGWKIPYVLNMNDNNKTPDLSLSDFLTPEMKMRNVSDIFKDLQNKGFCLSTNGDIKQFHKDGTSIDYYMDEMESASDCFYIKFPSVNDAKKFVSAIVKDNRWVPQKNYFGMTVDLKYKKVVVSIISIEDYASVGICSDR